MITDQADQMFTDQANERDQKRLEKTTSDKEYVRSAIARSI